MQVLSTQNDEEQYTGYGCVVLWVVRRKMGTQVDAVDMGIRWTKSGKVRGYIYVNKRRHCLSCFVSIFFAYKFLHTTMQLPPLVGCLYSDNKLFPPRCQHHFQTPYVHCCQHRRGSQQLTEHPPQYNSNIAWARLTHLCFLSSNASN